MVCSRPRTTSGRCTEPRRPALDEELIEEYVAGRLARHDVFSRKTPPFLSFVQEEVALRRPVGGGRVMRGQLERLLKIGQLRNVEIQVADGLRRPCRADCHLHAARPAQRPESQPHRAAALQPGHL
ncbi:Scr1 family TA system antitoxin-like transcriptional regulator [Streptomyces apocyni]|uniref:Scr1 family TA system antitoxin-like transcriptional regulator n=1 Tax=Streptomyces apocyni TaxID=2654677 RepID=UPI001E6009D8|nr:Scr1 family TA system antitoxin-like transcriptional regulator [Streptomyces apocyni]